MSRDANIMALDKHQAIEEGRAEAFAHFENYIADDMELLDECMKTIRNKAKEFDFEEDAEELMSGLFFKADTQKFEELRIIKDELLKVIGKI